VVNDDARQRSFTPLYVPAIAERLISPDECARIIATAEERGFRETSVLGGESEGAHLNPEVRVTDSAVLDPKLDRGVYDFIAKAITNVNNKQYRFGLVGLEPVQVLRYKVGSFFRDHSDLGYQSHSSAGRKISLIAQLSDGDSYEGGDLVMFGEEVMPRSQGTVCIIPAWLTHRVDKLTAGVRYTLVAWGKGPPFN
jgi:predicted 2-oxoglutarate/Fe(II)-dependent dioxygenase YbiX